MNHVYYFFFNFLQWPAHAQLIDKLSQSSYMFWHYWLGIVLKNKNACYRYLNKTHDILTNGTFWRRGSYLIIFVTLCLQGQIWQRCQNLGCPITRPILRPTNVFWRKKIINEGVFQAQLQSLPGDSHILLRSENYQHNLISNPGPSSYQIAATKFSSV